MIICFVLGALCTFIDIGICAWKKETRGLAIGISVFLGVVGAALGHVFFRLIHPHSTQLSLLAQATAEARNNDNENHA